MQVNEVIHNTMQVLIGLSLSGQFFFMKSALEDYGRCHPSVVSKSPSQICYSSQGHERFTWTFCTWWSVQ